MKKLTTEDFIIKANYIHNNKYFYTKAIYTSSRDKLLITCQVHGDFEQKANTHLNGAGCSKCSVERSTLTTRDFIKRAREVHGEYYKYLKVEYKGSKEKVIITCPIHGDFKQAPNSHLQGQTCLKCINDNQTCNTEYFIKKARAIHGNLYTYDRTNYTNKRNYVVITCPKHGDFKQTPSNHLTGKICKKCSNEVTQKYAWTKTSFTNLSPVATLYVLKCYNDKEEFIKIGITIKTVKERYSYSDMKYDYSILEEIKAPSDIIYDLEKFIHRTLKPFKYIPKNKFAGYTECFKLEAHLILNK